MPTREQLAEVDEAQFAFLLPLWLRRNLDERARVEDRSAGSVCRAALRWYLGTPPGQSRTSQVAARLDTELVENGAR